MSIDDLEIRNSNQLKFFNRLRINEEILKTRTFMNALFLVESSIINPQLSVKFAQTCLVKLRNEPIYNLRRCRRYITEIFKHLFKVCQNINFEVDQLTDASSSFALCHQTQATFDRITFDKATIVGAQIDYSNENYDKLVRTIFFFYSKILHELAHACIAELGRTMPSEEDDQRFTTPTTHALTDEAGNAIERHFFGSVIDAIGHYTDSTRTSYEIDHLIMSEKQINPFIKTDYLRRFFGLNFYVIDTIPQPETEDRDVKWKRKVSTGQRSSDTKRRCTNRLIRSPNSSALCHFHRVSSDSIDHRRELNINDEESDEEQSLCNIKGNFRYPAILTKY